MLATATTDMNDQDTKEAKSTREKILLEKYLATSATSKRRTILYSLLGHQCYIEVKAELERHRDKPFVKRDLQWMKENKFDLSAGKMQKTLCSVLAVAKA